MISTVKGRLIAKGRTAEVYAWPDKQVLKLFHDWVPEDWVRRELETGRALSTTSLPTPKLFDSTSLDGRRGIIFERFHPQATKGYVHAWMIPVAAARLSENIPGERQTILDFIARSLRELKAA